MGMVFVVHVGDYFFCASAVGWGERLVGAAEDVCVRVKYGVLVGVWVWVVLYIKDEKDLPQ